MMFSVVANDAATTTVKIEAPLRPLPFHMQFIAGGVAGVSEIMVMYPLDGKILLHSFDPGMD
jgi:hypothetical protein